MNGLPRLALSLALLLAGCGQAAPQAEPPPLAGSPIGGPLDLIDQNGRPLEQAALAGKYRLLYFGYTFCPDVCPVDMARLSAGLRELEGRDPALAARLQPIFVTVDPERDTPPALKAFAANFHPRFIALTGSPPAIRDVMADYLITAQRREGANPGYYLMDHSNQAYLMSPAGDPLALIPQDGRPAEIADALQRWMR